MSQDVLVKSEKVGRLYSWGRTQGMVRMKQANLKTSDMPQPIVVGTDKKEM